MRVSFKKSLQLYSKLCCRYFAVYFMSFFQTGSLKNTFPQTLVITTVVLSMYRSSHRKCSMKKGVFKNFTKFTGKRLCQSLFFNKVVGLRSSTLKKRLWHKCFPVNFVNSFHRTPLGDCFFLCNIHPNHWQMV